MYVMINISVTKLQCPTKLHVGMLQLRLIRRRRRKHVIEIHVSHSNTIIISDGYYSTIPIPQCDQFMKTDTQSANNIHICIKKYKCNAIHLK